MAGLWWPSKDWHHGRLRFRISVYPGALRVIAARIRARVAVLVAVAAFTAALVILYALKHGHTATASAPALPVVPTQPPVAPTPLPAPPQSSAASDDFANHGPGRVTCDVQWFQLHRPEAGYQDFIRNCMRRAEYPAPQSSAASDDFADHGPGRVTCDVQWSQLHRPEADYQDFIRKCMRRPQ